MSEKKKIKKSVTIDSTTAARSDDDSMRYQPGPQFTKVRSHSLKPCVDLSGVQEGSHELWLIQMPKHMNMNSINGASIQYKMPLETSTTGPMGSLETKEGVSFDLHQESHVLSQQLFVVGNNGSGLSMFPVKRRVNIDRITPEGPVGVINARSAAASRDLAGSAGGQGPALTPKKSKKRQAEEIDDEPESASQAGDDAVKSKKKKDKAEKKAKKKAME